MTAAFRRRVVYLIVGSLAFLGVWHFAPELLCAEIACFPQETQP